mmetsp:Transcript_17996/g.62279  ORF Transcript_17996/g.62279 Transcript_17996/m.62279 type:complete len:226 (+) Transcript_17996:542-1219(+)
MLTKLRRRGVELGPGTRFAGASSTTTAMSPLSADPRRGSSFSTSCSRGDASVCSSTARGLRRTCMQSARDPRGLWPGLSDDLGDGRHDGRRPAAAARTAFRSMKPSSSLCAWSRFRVLSDMRFRVLCRSACSTLSLDSRGSGLSASAKPLRLDADRISCFSCCGPDPEPRRSPLPLDDDPPKPKDTAPPILPGGAPGQPGRAAAHLLSNAPSGRSCGKASVTRDT